MKKILILLVVLVLILVGGIYASRNAVAPVVTDNTSATTTETSVIQSEGTVTLKLGETAAFKGLLITPLLVTEDSRCPVNANCIWAGTTGVKLELRSGLGTATKTVKLGEFVTTEAQKITFVSVEPQKTTAPIDSKNYKFTLKVEKYTAGAPVVKCFVGGCSGEVCSSEPNVASNCIYKPEFACYKNSTCEVQKATGKCGWTETATLMQCLNNAS